MIIVGHSSLSSFPQPTLNYTSENLLTYNNLPMCISLYIFFVFARCALDNLRGHCNHGCIDYLPNCRHYLLRKEA